MEVEEKGGGDGGGVGEGREGGEGGGGGPTSWYTLALFSDDETILQVDQQLTVGLFPMECQ